MGRKISQYLNNVSVTPDDLSLIDVSEKTGVASYESRKWSLSMLRLWIKNALGLVDGTENKIQKLNSEKKLVDSQITDDGNGIGIGVVPNANVKALVLSENRRQAFMASTKYAGGNPAIGSTGIADGLNTGENVGGEFIADNSTDKNIGVRSIASGSNAYLGQFSDGTEAVGKFIKSITSDGKARWANISASDISGIKYENNYSSGSWVGDELTVTHNLNTLSPNVFCYIENKLVEMEVLTIDNNTLSINKTSINSVPTSIKVGVSL